MEAITFTHLTRVNSSYNIQPKKHLRRNQVIQMKSSFQILYSTHPFHEYGEISHCSKILLISRIITKLEKALNLQKEIK